MSKDQHWSRRKFLKTGATAGASMAGLGGITFLTHPERVRGANDRVRVAVVGLRGRGFDHIKGYAQEPNAEVAAVCDADENVLAQRLADMQREGLRALKTYIDYRKLLEDPSIDAVSIATPNHWHALMGIWACQAGKDAYVEKPCSHNLWEGRQLVRAAQKYSRIVMHGTQGRSAGGYQEGVQKIREGFFLPLPEKLHAPVLPVAHPAGNAQPGGGLSGEKTEPHPLHGPPNDSPGRFHILPLKNTLLEIILQ